MRKATTTPTPASPATELVPLAHLVIEGLAENIDALAARLDDVAVDDVGRRCTTRDTARSLFGERSETEAATAAEAAARAEAEANRPPTEHERWRAAFLRTLEIRKRNAGIDDTPPEPEVCGVWLNGAPADEGLSAHDQARAVGEQVKLAARDEALAEQFNGGLTYHSLRSGGRK